MDKHNIKSNTNYRQALEKNTLMQKSKHTNEVIMMMMMIILMKYNNTGYFYVFYDIP
jgi:hypothetical protein